ncbi:unnamed protein product [Closterium sp. NIES-54]
MGTMGSGAFGGQEGCYFGNSVNNAGSSSDGGRFLSTAVNIPSNSSKLKPRRSSLSVSTTTTTRSGFNTSLASSLTCRSEPRLSSSIDVSSSARTRRFAPLTAPAPADAKPIQRSVGFTVKASASGACVAPAPSSDTQVAPRFVPLGADGKPGLASIQDLVEEVTSASSAAHSTHWPGLVTSLSGSVPGVWRVGTDSGAELVNTTLLSMPKLTALPNGGVRMHDTAAFRQVRSAIEIGRDPDALLSDDDWLRYAQKKHSVFYDPLVKLAFQVAADAHQGQFRKSGQPVVSHCVETALILAGIGADKVVVAAGLLHDVIDDTATSEQDLRDIFGDEIASLVAGVSKLSLVSQLTRDSSRQLTSCEIDNLRTMFVAMADVRVVLVKLADRMHCLRTIDALPAKTQQRISRETLDVFAPLANRLGIWSWKAEIEDACFRCLHPREHADLLAELDRTSRSGGNSSGFSGSSSGFTSSGVGCAGSRTGGGAEEGGAGSGSGGGGEASVMAAIRRLSAALEAKGVQFEDLCGRPKNLYSIFNKMTKKGRSLHEIMDVRGLRLIAADEAACYDALAVVHSLWAPWAGRHLKDYVRGPKPNGYQSIHSVVCGDDGLPLEVQIRTPAMHHQAEFGVAAHWRYKEAGFRDNNGEKALGKEKSDSSSSSRKQEGKKSFPSSSSSSGPSPAVLAKIEWVRYVLSWYSEMSDTKLRLSPPSKRLSPSSLYLASMAAVGCGAPATAATATAASSPSCSPCSSPACSTPTSCSPAGSYPSHCMGAGASGSAAAGGACGTDCDEASSSELHERCPFPEHLESCRFRTFPFSSSPAIPLPAGAAFAATSAPGAVGAFAEAGTPFSSAPVPPAAAAMEDEEIYVLVMDGDSISVREVPATTTVAAFLEQYAEEESSLQSFSHEKPEKLKEGGSPDSLLLRELWQKQDELRLTRHQQTHVEQQQGEQEAGAGRGGRISLQVNSEVVGEGEAASRRLKMGDLVEVVLDRAAVAAANFTVAAGGSAAAASGAVGAGPGAGRVLEEVLPGAGAAFEGVTGEAVVEEGLEEGGLLPAFAMLHEEDDEDWLVVAHGRSSTSSSKNNLGGTLATGVMAGAWCL